MIVLGLTGSIAMGKSETAKMFIGEGVPVFDADAEVHRLYAKDGAAVEPIATRWPEVIVDDAVDRAALSSLILRQSEVLAEIEALVHPLVRAAERQFLDRYRAAQTPVVVLDLPLLFETGRQSAVDKVVVVSAPAAVQRQRALARPGMTDEKLARILARQLPDSEKCAQADFIVDTSQGFDHARRQVRAILAAVTT